MDVNMDGSTSSDHGTCKSWDHPWCTDEMRNNRREWSLAGDAGLLKHLQSFSENLTTKANQTQGALDSLTNRLNETAVFVDNLTNTSLALANTQFIESRVQEDDVEIEKPTDQVAKNVKDQEKSAADVITSMNKSIEEGLRIINEKYDIVDVIASDSEDEGENALPSIVLHPKDPYQNRLLPYVIGSEKWEASNKIGLESSSSESEQMEEDDEESSLHLDNKGMDDILNTNNRKKSNLSRLSSTSSESNDYNLDSNSPRDTNNGSLRAKSQDTLNLESEPMTPTSVLPKSHNTNSGPPSFAEELAKRLGSVLPSQKTVITQEANDPSINNRTKDDLFAQEEDEDVFSNRSENLFRGGGGLFDDDASTAKWNTTIPKPVKTNMIPSSIDIPPPISSTSTKPKSAFDDLFGDADSEDSDDIFSTKNVKKSVSKNEKVQNKAEFMDRKYLTSGFAENVGSMATSTPETQDAVKNLFDDDELNEDDLFSTSKPRNRDVSETPTDKVGRKKPVGGIPVMGGVEIFSSKLSNKIFRQSSSDSSSSESASYSNTPSNATNSGTQNPVLNDNLPDSSSIVAANKASHSNRNLENSTNSSGISIQPSSINNTDGSSLGVDFQPQMTSTRLKSEEIYREKINSDSLYAAPTEVLDSTNSNSSSNVNQIQESSRYQDDIFDDDDVFGPPPLPKGESKSSKSKAISLFDDSDSEDELFFGLGSINRSQKSVNVSVNPQVQDKSKPSKKLSLFDDDDDIFGAKDSPDVDIFAVETKPLSAATDEFSTQETSGVASDLFADLDKSNSSKIVAPKASVENSLVKSTSLFDDSDEEDLFGSNLSKQGSKFPSIFDDDMNLPTESLTSSSSIMGTIQSNIQKTVKTETVDKVEDSSQNIFAASKGGLFNDDIEDDDLFSQKAPLPTKVEENFGKIKTDSSDSEILKESTTSSEIIEPNVEAKMTPKIPEKPDNISLRGNQIKKEKTDENVVDGACVSKRDPPKTLNVHSTSSSATEEISQVSRREVSGKIKDLMGKMGGLKILSPTDTHPVLRKNEEKNEEEEESLEGDSEDGGSLSIPSSEKETSVSVDSLPRKESSKSMLIINKNKEEAISFDELSNVEILTTASKSRVRIPVKRRPQSRRARQTALRQSGIDFDAVDSSKNPDVDHEDEFRDKEIGPRPEVISDSNSERLIVPTIIADKADNPSNTEFSLSLAIDDKSERSLSKESTANKNTLLSPSTDEEDLFDVPPDLPEDPFREDSLFGRAPIMSPVDDLVNSANEESDKINAVMLSSSLEVDKEAKDSIKSIEKEENEPKLEKTVESIINKESTEPQDVFSQDENKDSPLDPLRNSDPDPLKDPSQLFAFVTKTPSPEKSNALLFNEDDSLFLSTSNQAKETSTTSTKKMDLLFDDASEDLFSAPLVKSGMKPLKDTRISLFDDDTNDDDEDSLFGTTSKNKSAEMVNASKSKKTETSEQGSVSQRGIFESDSEEHLFADGTQVKIPKVDVSVNKTKTSNMQDIFGDQSSEEEDLFAFKKTISKKPTRETKSLFNDDDDGDGDDIFGKPNSSMSMPTESRSSIKKAITRDLKKTADQIVEDPLRMLLDD